MKLFLKNSNLCDHNSPTSQTDGRTDRQTTCDRNTALCTKVHRAVKTQQLLFSKRAGRRLFFQTAIKSARFGKRLLIVLVISNSVTVSLMEGRDSVVWLCLQCWRQRRENFKRNLCSPTKIVRQRFRKKQTPLRRFDV